MDLSQDFRDLLAAFARHAVDYLLIGGYAVAFHGRPRFTKDIDLWLGDSAADLVIAKEAAGRAQDLRDAEMLRELLDE